jgi:hypothetical protein
MPLIDADQSQLTKLRYPSTNPTKRQKAIPKDQYQTVKEVVYRLKVAEVTGQHRIKEGQLRAIDIGKGWRIADADLANFLLAHQTAPKMKQAGLNGLAPDGEVQCWS